LQRRDDAGQVNADRPVGVRGPAVGDSVEDGQVLAQRDLRPAGAQRQLELVPDELAVQPLDQADRDVLSGDDPDPAVQFPVELGVLERVAFAHRALDRLGEVAELRRFLIGDPLRGLGGAQCLQGHPALGDGYRLFRGDGTDPGTAVGDPLNEALGGQVEQRRPQGLPGDPERSRQFLLDEPLAGREVAVEYGLPERGQRVRSRCFPGPRPVFPCSRPPPRSCCHAPTLRTFPADCQQLTGLIVDNQLGLSAIACLALYGVDGILQGIMVLAGKIFRYAP
jgi:hypothetical protein